MTGKLADTVMSVRNGEQIARKYQPKVLNPSTAAQVAQRAKLKLLSQLSAVMAPVIAIPKQGSVSSRNLFVKDNFRNTSFADNTASVDLLKVQITRSVVSLPNVVITPASGDVSFNTYQLNAPAGVINVDRVVYSVFTRQSDNSLRFVESLVATQQGENSWQMNGLGLTNVVVFAYGVRDNTQAARTAFGNLKVLSAETIANLIVTRTLTESDITLTETRAAEYPTS